MEKIEEEEAAEEAAEEATAVSEEAAVADSAAVQEKCTRQHVQNADRNVKCLSSLQKENLYFAGNVTRKEESFSLS